jgi:hypothetical protein
MWLRLLSRTSGTNPCKKLTFTKIESTRRVVRKSPPPLVKWLDGVEQDLTTLEKYELEESGYEK